MSPVSQQPGLDMIPSRWLAQQGIFLQVNLADRQVIGCLPLPMQVLQALESRCAVGYFFAGFVSLPVKRSLRFRAECQYRPLTALLINSRLR